MAHCLYTAGILVVIMPQCVYVVQPKFPPSAGVGRTGTFIALDVGLQQIEVNGVIDVRSLVARMRTERNLMVQTEVNFSGCVDTDSCIPVMLNNRFILCHLFVPCPINCTPFLSTDPTKYNNIDNKN